MTYVIRARDHHHPPTRWGCAHSLCHEQQRWRRRRRRDSFVPFSSVSLEAVDVLREFFPLLQSFSSLCTGGTVAHATYRWCTPIVFSTVNAIIPHRASHILRERVWRYMYMYVKIYADSCRRRRLQLYRLRYCREGNDSKPTLRLYSGGISKVNNTKEEIDAISRCTAADAAAAACACYCVAHFTLPAMHHVIRPCSRRRILHSHCTLYAASLYRMRIMFANGHDEMSMFNSRVPFILLISATIAHDSVWTWRVSFDDIFMQWHSHFMFDGP